LTLPYRFPGDWTHIGPCAVSQGRSSANRAARTAAGGARRSAAGLGHPLSENQPTRTRAVGALTSNVTPHAKVGGGSVRGSLLRSGGPEAASHLLKTGSASRQCRRAEASRACPPESTLLEYLEHPFHCWRATATQIPHLRPRSSPSDGRGRCHCRAAAGRRFRSMGHRWGFPDPR